MRQFPIDPEPWMDRGLCRDHPEPDLWFPATRNPSDSAEAIFICLQCPVRPECADLAVRSGAEFGIWGGFDAHMIRTLRRKAKR